MSAAIACRLRQQTDHIQKKYLRSSMSKSCRAEVLFTSKLLPKDVLSHFLL